MEHSFDIEEAAMFGLEEAIVIRHFRFWITKNEKNEKHLLPIPAHYNIKESRYWTYSSARALAEIFPYLNPRKVNYAMTRLCATGILLKGNFNEKAYDKTTWYAFAHRDAHRVTLGEISRRAGEESLLQNCKMDFTILSNASTKIVKPIPDINTDTPFPNGKGIPRKFDSKGIATEYDRIMAGLYQGHSIAYEPMNWGLHGGTMQSLKKIDQAIAQLAKEKYKSSTGRTIEELEKAAFEFVLTAAFSYYHEIAKSTNSTTTVTPERIHLKFNTIINHGKQRIAIGNERKQSATIAQTDGW